MPLTEAQLNANRQNAQRSTGPRTPEGKQRSALNATRHTLSGQVRVTTPEDMVAYDKHKQGFFGGFQTTRQRRNASHANSRRQAMADALRSSLLQSIQVLANSNSRTRSTWSIPKYTPRSPPAS
jgi:hypothetical protein